MGNFAPLFQVQKSQVTGTWLLYYCDALSRFTCEAYYMRSTFIFGTLTSTTQVISIWREGNVLVSQ